MSKTDAVEEAAKNLNWKKITKNVAIGTAAVVTGSVLLAQVRKFTSRSSETPESDN